MAMQYDQEYADRVRSLVNVLNKAIKNCERRDMQVQVEMDDDGKVSAEIFKRV